RSLRGAGPWARAGDRIAARGGGGPRRDRGVSGEEVVGEAECVDRDRARSTSWSKRSGRWARSSPSPCGRGLGGGGGSSPRRFFPSFPFFSSFPFSHA